MNRYFFTFGYDVDVVHRDCYHVEVAKNYMKAREQMIDKFGTDWAFQYSEDEWRICREDYKKTHRNGTMLNPMARGLHARGNV